jgi:hypothetical protein
MDDWTSERVAKLPIEQVKSLRENARRRGENAVVELCNTEIDRRKLVRERPSRTRPSSESRDGQIVIGFHFVCDKGKGVTADVDGRVWTGTWVVDKIHAEKGVRIGAYVALHATKAEPSYLQGIIEDWRQSPREREYAEGRPVRIESGIDFLIRPTDKPYRWEGDGSGEKGYAWRPIRAMAETTRP